jgi:hypothetical protein
MSLVGTGHTAVGRKPGSHTRSRVGIGGEVACYGDAHDRTSHPVCPPTHDALASAQGFATPP